MDARPSDVLHALQTSGEQCTCHLGHPLNEIIEIGSFPQRSTLGSQKVLADLFDKHAAKFVSCTGFLVGEFPDDDIVIPGFERIKVEQFLQAHAGVCPKAWYVVLFAHGVHGDYESKRVQIAAVIASRVFTKRVAAVPCLWNYKSVQALNIEMGIVEIVDHRFEKKALIFLQIHPAGIVFLLSIRGVENVHY